MPGARRDASAWQSEEGLGGCVQARGGCSRGASSRPGWAPGPFGRLRARTGHEADCAHCALCGSSPRRESCGVASREVVHRRRVRRSRSCERPWRPVAGPGSSQAARQARSHQVAAQAADAAALRGRRRRGGCGSLGDSTQGAFRQSGLSQRGVRRAAPSGSGRTHRPAGPPEATRCGLTAWRRCRVVCSSAW